MIKKLKEKIINKINNKLLKQNNNLKEEIKKLKKELVETKKQNHDLIDQKILDNIKIRELKMEAKK